MMRNHAINTVWTMNGVGGGVGAVDGVGAVGILFMLE